MIAKGNLHAHGGKLAAYLTTGKKGERAELLEMRGFATEDIRTAFLDIEIQAYGTRATKPFFHAYTRLAPGEELDRAQWMQVADREEKRLGFAGQPRAIAFHHQADGATHMHIVWSRIDTEQGCAIDPGLYKNKLKELCRALEKELDLTPVRNEREAHDTTRSAGRNEFEQARRLETDLKAIRSTIKDCWEHSDNGKSFAAALDAEGLILARGDRRDFVVIDAAGGDHALSKRITGATAAETRTRLADLDPTQLPSVDEAKTLQASRAVERDALQAERAGIEQAAERAMQEARAAAAGWTDDTRPLFAAGAARTTEPAAPIFDRDAANRQWEADIENAAIAKEQASRSPQDNRQQRGDAAGMETRAGAEEPSGGPATRPLGQMAGDIRTAWTLSRSAEQLEEALAAKGLTLATVSAEEAWQSERTAAFAKQVGNFARVLKENEIVVVNQYGDVFRLDQRTTGEVRPDIAARFPQLDRDALLSVSDTAEVMRDAARAAWQSERQAEREQMRPLSEIEAAIADALTSTMTGTEFAAALDKAGITIARVSETDVRALDALRHDEEFARLVAEVNREARKDQYFVTLDLGDLAAVTRTGEVFRLSPHKLDADDIEQRLADVQQRLPGVVEARAASEIKREETAELWDRRRADFGAAREARGEAIEAQREMRETVRDARGVLGAADAAVDVGERAVSKGFSKLAKAVENILSGIFNFFGGGEPKLTPMQRELAARANEELVEQRAVNAAAAQKEAEADERIFEQNRQQQREDVERATGLRERPGDRERERERDR